MSTTELLLLAAMSERTEAVKQLISLSGHNVRDLERKAEALRIHAEFLASCLNQEREKSQSAARAQDSAK